MKSLERRKMALVQRLAGNAVRRMDRLQETPLPPGETGQWIALEALDAHREAAPRYLQLIQQLVRATERGDRPEPMPLQVTGAFAFTAPHAGSGVTSVLDALGAELASATGEPVLIAAAAALGQPLSAQGGALQQLPANRPAGVFTLRPRALASPAWDARLLQENVREARRHVRWVLIDCPPVHQSPQALAVAPHVDGLILVVEADRSTRPEILRARRAIERSAGQVLGCVLTKRTYPVPEFLHRRL